MLYSFQNSKPQYQFCIIPLLNSLYYHILFQLLVLLDTKISFSAFLNVLLAFTCASQVLLAIFKAFVWELIFSGQNSQKPQLRNLTYLDTCTFSWLKWKLHSIFKSFYKYFSTFIMCIQTFNSISKAFFSSCLLALFFC